MRRSEWINGVLEAWNGQPCPNCGRAMRAYDVDPDGAVYSYCNHCGKPFWVAWEPTPSHFDPEAELDDLPF